MSKTKKIIYALSTLAATIIGVGLFALPYITLKVGVWIMLGYFLVLTPLVILIHQFFAEVVISTRDFLRMPSFAEIYLGKWGRRVALLAAVLGLTGAILAYIIIGGKFLENLLAPVLGGNDFFYTFIYFAAGAIMIFFGIKAISKIQFLDIFLFAVILIAVYFGGSSFMKIGNLFYKSGGGEGLFLPYGAIIFSLWGAAMIPEIEEMLGEEKRLLKKVIPWSVVVPAIFYLLFILVVLSVSGIHTSEDAITGLEGFLGNGMALLLFLFGLVVTFTSYIAMGLTLKKVFCYDLKINENISWMIACFVPFALYLIGLQDFVRVIGLVGSVALGIEGILIVLAYRKLAEIKRAAGGAGGRLDFLVYPLIFVLMAGIICEIIYFVR